MAPSEVSLKTYNAKVRLLRQAVGAPESDFNFLKKTTEIVNYIEGLEASLNTKKMYYIAIVSILKDMKGYTKPLKIYRDKMMAYNAKQGEIYDKQELSASETGKWLPWDEILKVRKQAEDDVTDLKTFQSYLLLCIYTYLPPMRLDVGALKVVNEAPKEPVCNYYVNGKHPEILLTEYKTSTKFGTQHIKIPAELVDIIKLYLELYEPEFLFENNKSQPMSEALLSKNIIDIFKKYTNRAIGVNMLRHAYVSHHRANDMPAKKSKALAKSMMHSPETSTLYRRIE